jgi:GNAT superfamily N-acetyltransferase
MITLDLFDPKDTEQFFELFRDWDRNYPFDRETFMASLSRIDPKTSRLIVAKENGDLVGYAQFTRQAEIGFEESLEVVQLLVAEDKRGRGIGRMLMAEAERIAEAEGIGVLKLSSRIQRSKAHVFYESLGYELAKISKFYQKKLRK